ncbi:hypothetical protein [Nonomuraea sp. LPB2021202275-12-8]|uniref:hypothetical protein n=1 Tax=Nonomuraea sp. LPB2021202275-12-8 TaxID=3120159 RepID=UPI00300C1E62
MKRRVRSLLTTATGVAVLFGGIGVTGLTATSASASQHAPSAAPDFTGDVSASAYVPVEGDAGASVTLRLKAPETVKSVTGGVVPPGKAERPVTFDFKPGASVVTGKWTIGKDDPAGDWKLTVKVVRGSAQANEFAVKVSGKQGISAAAVTPDPVKLVKGKDVRVSVEASVKGSSSVSAKLVSDESSEYHDLGALAREPDGYHRGSTYFSDDTAAGAWTLEVYATRGGEALKSLTSFTVEAAAGGVTKKAKARVTIGAAKKVKKGKTFKVYGKAFRGTKPYKGKKLKIYFKAKGTRTYKLVGFATTISSGKYTKSVKARKDGYFRVTSPGTSKTRAALSPQRLVDVR